MATNRASELNSVEEVQLGLSEVGYLATTEIATVLFLAQELGKPILVEGPAGTCLLYTSPSPRDRQKSRMPSSA